MSTMIAALMLLGVSPAALGAQEQAEKPGEVVLVSELSGFDIALDGDLGDWDEIPVVTTNTGPTPSVDPENGNLRWQLAAHGNVLYFAATIADTNIIAGEHGDQYWNEDSIELYLDISNDPALTTYSDGVGQITFSPIDLGKTEPAELTSIGIGADGFDVDGIVFSTETGWGVEAAVALPDLSLIHI